MRAELWTKDGSLEACQSEVRLGEDEVPDDPHVLECVVGIRPSPIFRLCKISKCSSALPALHILAKPTKSHQEISRNIFGKRYCTLYYLYWHVWHH